MENNTCLFPSIYHIGYYRSLFVSDGNQQCKGILFFTKEMLQIYNIMTNSTLTTWIQLIYY